MELGPSGYIFEKFIAEIFKHKGYRVQTGTVVKGHCVMHEIDVIAEKDHELLLIECKYHNKPGSVCDVKVPLYIHSRFSDVEKEWLKIPGNGTKKYQGWVATNTRFTTDAIQYGTCSGMSMLGWDYPQENNLADYIHKFRLHPITTLTSLTKFEKQKLLEKNILLCKELYENENLLASSGINIRRISEIMNEVRAVCK